MVLRTSLFTTHMTLFSCILAKISGTKDTFRSHWTSNQKIIKYRVLLKTDRLDKDTFLADNKKR